MIKTTSLELSKRLYELAPEWNDTTFYWRDFGNNTWRVWYPNKEMFEPTRRAIPAPDLEWLLDKLPNMVIENDYGYLVATKDTKGTPFALTHIENGNWFADYQGYFMTEAETPCDAACKLLINLIEQEIVKI